MQPQKKETIEHHRKDARRRKLKKNVHFFLRRQTLSIQNGHWPLIKYANNGFVFIYRLPFFSCRCGPTRTDERQKKTRIEVKKKCISTKEKEIFVSNETLRLAVFRKVVAEINAAKKKQKKKQTKQKRNAGTGVEGAVPIRDVIDWLRPAPAATARRWVEPGKEGGGGHSRAKKKGKKRKKKRKKK